MELLKNLSKVFNIVFPFADFLYILQQEEYSSDRFIYWLRKFFFRRNFQVRDNLKYTKRVKVTLFLAVALFLIDIVLLIILNLLIFLPFNFVLIPLYVLASNFILNYYYNWVKSGVRKEAAEIRDSMKNLKVVTVAGSYGKTTVKNFVHQLVKYSYKTQMIPGNINTPTGIAIWIKNNLQKDTELLVSEVDAYVVDEIGKSTRILKPDIAVLTNIGDQHLIRFNGRNELAKALSETFVYSKDTASLISTSEVFLELNQIDFGNRSRFEVTSSEVKNDLSDSNKTNLAFALKVCELLNVEQRFIDDALSKLELPDRRQRLTNVLGFDGIDDSYNISFTTALAGIKEARKQADKLKKKLVVITAGIPELSDENQDKNFELGKILKESADFTVVLRSDLSNDIINGLKGSKFIVMKSFKDFLTKEITNFERDEWFILQQPELNDLYY